MNGCAETMRIAQIAPLAESVPPKLYGGTERVVSWLVDELVGLGHEVTLFASGDSRTRAKLVSICPRALRLARPRVDVTAAQAAQLEAVARRISDFDVIHSHIDWIHLPILHRAGVPFLTTFHGRLDLGGLRNVIDLFPEAPFVSISEDQRRPLQGARWLGTVYHGLPEAALQPSYDAENYLAFPGRLTHEKGPDVAIRIAKATGMQLRIAAKVPRASRGYFKEQLEPLIDGIRFSSSGRLTLETRFSRRRGRIAVSDRLAGAVWPGDDRSDGLWHAGDCIPCRIGAGGYRGWRQRIHCGFRRGSHSCRQARAIAGQAQNSPDIRRKVYRASNGARLSSMLPATR